MRNTAQFVTAEVGFVQVCRSERCQILADFAEAVVTIAIGQAAECCAGEQAVLGVTRQGEIDAQSRVSDCRQQTVVVIVIAERVGSVYAKGSDAKIIVVAASQAAGNRTGQGGTGQPGKKGYYPAGSLLLSHGVFFFKKLKCHSANFISRTTPFYR